MPSNKYITSVLLQVIMYIYLNLFKQFKFAHSKKINRKFLTYNEALKNVNLTKKGLIHATQSDGPHPSSVKF